MYLHVIYEFIIFISYYIWAQYYIFIYEIFPIFSQFDFIKLLGTYTVYNF